MTEEDEEFNRIEREAKQRMEAVSAALDKMAENARELGLMPYYGGDYEPAQQREPIYQMQMIDGKWIDQAKHSYEYNKAHGHTVRIVYTSPQPSKPWVGLTDEDRAQCVQATVESGEALKLMLFIEAKLKEKNNG